MWGGGKPSVDKQTQGHKLASGPGSVTHWAVATVHVSGLGPTVAGGFGPLFGFPEFQTPA